MDFVDRRKLLEWCSIPFSELVDHAGLRVPFRMVRDSAEMGQLMARELVDVVKANNAANEPTRAIIPCGPTCWYAPFAGIVNSERVSLRNLTTFHMDECLDWQNRTLSENHPYNFAAFLNRHFYGPIDPELAIPQEQRYPLAPATADRVRQAIWAAPIDITLGGWGQDGHVAYNQARRHPFSHVTLDELSECSIRIQENNIDTIVTLAQRSFGAAYQFVPPMSITLGLKECLSAKKVRVFSDTGAWKQTALRVALFSEPVAEYPMTLLQRHPDAIVTATADTAAHPISEHPEWELL